MPHVDSVSPSWAERSSDDEHDLESDLLQAFEMDAPPETLDGLSNPAGFSYEHPEARDF